MTWGFKSAQPMGAGRAAVEAWAFGGGQMRHCTFEGECRAAVEDEALTWCMATEVALYAGAPPAQAEGSEHWWDPTVPPPAGDVSRETSPDRDRWWSTPPAPPSLAEATETIDRLCGGEQQ